MTKSAKSILVICTLVLAALVLQAGAAAACTQQCVQVNGFFCQQCVDTGEFTGFTCTQFGSCSCQRTPNTCGLAVSSIQAQTGLAAATAPEKGEVCSTPTSENTLSFLR